MERAFSLAASARDGAWVGMQQAAAAMHWGIEELLVPSDSTGHAPDTGAEPTGGAAGELQQQELQQLASSGSFSSTASSPEPEPAALAAPPATPAAAAAAAAAGARPAATAMVAAAAAESETPAPAGEAAAAAAAARRRQPQHQISGTEAMPAAGAPDLRGAHDASSHCASKAATRTFSGDSGGSLFWLHSPLPQVR
eukprot:TRINITY_DN1824_c2_g2_i3.p2 TRINITY_DN1824_c2_g2~~TRINITY_DN1824_c2_g2_i3.p2  ORF type:complete len:197 (+),score=56.51 TRINITY_DN1824_c2_g2_i3:114-704(+)